MVSKTEEEIENLNCIEIAGVIVRSNTNTLKEIEEIVNRLLEKHKDFLISKQHEKALGGYIT